MGPAGGQWTRTLARPLAQAVAVAELLTAELEISLGSRSASLVAPSAGWNRDETMDLLCGPQSQRLLCGTTAGKTRNG